MPIVNDTRAYDSSMEDSDYYIFRQGGARPPLEFTEFRRIVLGWLERLENEGWFQASLGKDCTDAPLDVAAKVLEELGYELWPLSYALKEEEEAWLFTGIEFGWRHAAKPVESYLHSWDQCGTHVTLADRDGGREEYRSRANELLGRYVRPHELAADGLIYELAPAGLEDLAPEPTGDAGIDTRVTSAISAFRKYGADVNSKRHAVRDLADVLELLRERVGTGLTRKDEAYLFDLANNFAIRHWNSKQRTDYRDEIWLDWMFYAFLNTITLATRLVLPSAGSEREP